MGYLFLSTPAQNVCAFSHPFFAFPFDPSFLLFLQRLAKFYIMILLQNLVIRRDFRGIIPYFAAKSVPHLLLSIYAVFLDIFKELFEIFKEK